MDRKYKQRGYSDPESEDKKRERSERSNGDSRPKGSTRPKLEKIGPRTPGMVGKGMRGGGSSCGAVRMPGFDPTGQCPRCHAEMHSCKQCVHFDTGKQFECTQPIPERIAKKDAKNDCTFFELRMTVEKDISPVNYAAATPPAAPAAGRPNDARKAFEDLFKK